jgi:ABC-type transport system involved in multi-copper enzyme maturation permease subunit
VRLPLLHKELREQRPFLFLGLFFVAMDVLDLLLLRSPDLLPLALTVRGEGDEGTRVMLLLLSFALSAGLLTRERDEGTLEFLDALPVTRSRLFWAKVAVALPVLMVYPVGVALLQGLQQAASRTSLDTGLHLGTLVTGVLLRGALVFSVLALGLFLSHLRSLSWLVLGVLALGLLLLAEQVPALDALNPMALARAEFMGSRWRVPWPALRLQLPVAPA